MSLQVAAALGVFQLILFLIHGAVYQTLAAAFGLSHPWLAWFSAVLSVTFVTASFLIYFFDNLFTRWYYRVSAFWFGFIQFLFAGSIVFYFLALVIYETNNYISPTIIGAISFGIFGLLGLYATWETNQLRFTRIVMPLPKLPDQWRGKKIVLVTDVHLGAIRAKNFARRIVNRINAEVPAAVLIAGDMFDGVKCNPKLLMTPFKDLTSSHGAYFATGNHEYIKDTATFLKAIGDAGIRILNNETIEVEGLVIGGVDWKDSYTREQFENVLGGMHIDRAKPTILMRHEPNHLEVAERAGVSAVVSGHTHAGQIFPLGFVTRRIYKGFDYGLKQLREMVVYTSSGIGTWGPPFRLGTKSEIVVITLQ